MPWYVMLRSFWTRRKKCNSNSNSNSNSNGASLLLCNHVPFPPPHPQPQPPSPPGHEKYAHKRHKHTSLSADKKPNSQREPGYGMVWKANIHHAFFRHARAKGRRRIIHCGASFFFRQQIAAPPSLIASLVYSVCVCNVYRWRVSCRVLLGHELRRVSGDAVEQLALALSALDLLRRLCFAWPGLVPGAVEPAM